MKYLYRYKTSLIIALLISSITIIFIYNNKTTIVNKSLESQPAPATKSISLMTYNIHRGVDINGDSNLDEITKIINKNKLDIIGLNEVDQYTKRAGFRNQIAILANKTKMNYVYGPNISVSFGKYGNALLSKYPILEAKNHPLPKFDENETRGMIDARVLLPDNKEYHILVTHLSINQEERKLQMEWIENYASMLDRPYIIMGDFNEEIGLSESHISLIDSIKTFPSNKPEKQIDHIFTDTELEIVARKSFDIELSDHLPLYIEFIPVPHMAK